MERKKHLYLIGGTMGIGKTTVCQVLKYQLDNCVFLDGDWCWDAHPFIVNENTKAMVMDNICYLLNNFIHCASYQHIIFCWVMHEQSIIDDICSKLDTSHCQVHPISLICDEKALKERLTKDVREGICKEDVIARSIQRISLYHRLNTLKIDVSHLTVEKTAQRIITLTNTDE